jgi:hypothetical protein
VTKGKGMDMGGLLAGRTKHPLEEGTIIHVKGLSHQLEGILALDNVEGKKVPALPFVRIGQIALLCLPFAGSVRTIFSGNNRILLSSMYTKYMNTGTLLLFHISKYRQYEAPDP